MLIRYIGPYKALDVEGRGKGGKGGLYHLSATVGDPESSHHFVEDKQCTVLGAHLTDTLEEFLPGVRQQAKTRYQGGSKTPAACARSSSSSSGPDPDVRRSYSNTS